MKKTKGAKRLLGMQKQFTFKALAKLTGVSAESLSRYSRGLRTPVLRHAVLIEDTLRIEVREWLK